MMGGGVCWLDYNGDGWQDLFAVNSYSSADTARWEAHGGLPRTQLFENVHGHFHNVTASSPRRASGARRRLRGSGSERRRPARLDRDDDDRDQAALEQRQRHLHRGCAGRRDDRVGLVHGSRRRGRERRRPPGRVRRRLRAPVRHRPELARGVPDEPRRSPRPPLPERGERAERPHALPRGRGPGRSRGVRLLARPRRDLPGRQRRRTSRPLRRERRGSEPALHRRPVAGRSEGRPGGARLPLREPRRGIGSGGSVRRHGRRRRRRRRRSARPVRHQLAQRAVGRVREDDRVLVLERAARLRPGARSRLRGLGRLVRRPGELGPAGSRGRDRRDPGHELEEGRRPGEGDRSARRRAGRPIRRRAGRRTAAARERARARGGRRRQRRPRRDRGQLDRRQAPPAEADRPGRPLARREALAVQPRGGGDGRPRRGQGFRRRSARAAAICPPRTSASTSASARGRG